MEGIGQRIYEERKKKGLSQGELGEKLDLSAKAVSKWETGETQPTLDNVSRLAEIFEVSTDYLLKGNEAGNAANAPHLHYLEPQKETRHKLRLAAWIVIGIGVAIVLFGVVGFLAQANASANGGGVGFLSLIFIYVGASVVGAGLGLLFFGYAGAVSRYAASEMAPVKKDTTNYLLDGTRNETKKTVQEVVQAVKGNGESQGPVCPKCGKENTAGSFYCDNCGASLNKKCPACGELNAPEAKYCRKCGKSL